MVKEKKAHDFPKYTSHIFHSTTGNLSHLNRIDLKYRVSHNAVLPGITPVERLCSTCSKSIKN